ncbi:unnamed protein product [Microthlaspi erraticum]|uniref:Uncharacterized protein n=1 Tax=Microthlaspi erraticum TaxID=1685480 RepID=A0A6D2IWM7_9BRAS|nr:unnamed protein product [Microthlaspi erraticum]
MPCSTVSRLLLKGLERLSLRPKRSFSSSSATTPYLTLGTKLKQDLPDGSEIRDVLYFDPSNEDEMVTVADKTFPKELVTSRQIGSCLGWGVFYNEGCLHLSESAFI